MCRLLVVLLLTGCAASVAAPQTPPPDDLGFPLTIDNCGTEVTLDAAPERVVTIKSTSTEMMLALGLGDRIVGTACQDGPVPEQWAADAAGIPSLAQTAPAVSEAASVEAIGRVVLVLPFDNRSGQSALDWVGDSFPDTLNQRLSSAGFLTISNDDRQFALDHLGLPIDFKPSRATTIRIAQTLNANFVIVGSYTVNKDHIAVQAQQPLFCQCRDLRGIQLRAPALFIGRQVDPFRQAQVHQQMLARRFVP